MRIKILFVLSVVLLASCTVQEDSNPALQGAVNEDFFGAIDARAIENLDGSFLIQGTTHNQNLSIYVDSPQAGTYSFGGDSKNYATFSNENNAVYYTNPYGEGQVTITNWDSTNQTLTGKFDFTAIIPGIDSINVSNGIFYKVPYALEVVDDPIDDPVVEPDTNAGSFAARVDGVTYSPYSVTAVNSDCIITVTGIAINKAISVSFPCDISQGSYLITDPGFSASYRVGDTTEEAISGQVIVIEHIPGANSIKGTFSFLTENHSVALGQFNVTYEDI